MTYNVFGGTLNLAQPTCMFGLSGAHESSRQKELHLISAQ